MLQPVDRIQAGKALISRCLLHVQILKGLPFFANATNTLFDRVLAAGQLIMYTAGDVVWHPPPSADKKRGKKSSSGNDYRGLPGFTPLIRTVHC